MVLILAYLERIPSSFSFLYLQVSSYDKFSSSQPPQILEYGHGLSTLDKLFFMYSVTLASLNFLDSFVILIFTISVGRAFSTKVILLFK